MATGPVDLPPAPPRTRRWVVPEDPEVGLAFLGAALGGLTTAEAPPTGLQLGLLAALVSAFAGAPMGVDELDGVPRLEPAEAAVAVRDPALREELVLLLITCEQLLHPLPAALHRRVGAYADALGIHPDALLVSRDLAGHHLALAYADIQRKSWFREETVHEAMRGRLVELTRSKLAYYGVGEDAALAARWRGLRDLPEGSWGRGVADFYRVHGFPFPGERHGIYEIGAHHDFLHVLCDYAPTPEGEIDVFAFIAATMDDPHGFMQLVFTLALFQSGAVDRVGGLKVRLARTDTLADDGALERMADAFRRAAACPVDVMAGIDHFAWAPHPLALVRERLGVVPKGVPGPSYLDR